MRHGRAFAIIVVLARLFGTNRVADLVRSLEGDEEEAYAGQQTPETESIAADERQHAAIGMRSRGETPRATTTVRRALARRRCTGVAGRGLCARRFSVPTTASSATCR